MSAKSRIGAKEYNSIHQWMRRTYKKTGKCERCETICKTEWSNKSGDYVRDREDWQEFCKRCHNHYDRAMREPPMPGYLRAAVEKAKKQEAPYVYIYGVAHRWQRERRARASSNVPQ